ncbi:siderophore-interacting protein [Novosphingobium sp. BL-52-GroH]|uniref:siderophore-interacting protein n=1 Tax=Novosphingobium sp. BL-52-GroH TaxID=3349877 RepID=UPI003850D0E0
MTSTRSPEPIASRQPGAFSKALIRLFMKQATVAASEPVGEGFHLITLESPEFVGAAWVPGEKVQIALGSAFTTRTYTPIEWDATAGRTRILAYVHGSCGPGSDWVRTARPGDACDVFGPRSSLDLTALPAPIVLFGDETAFGLALAAGQGAQCLFEVNSAEAAQPVLEHLGLGTSKLFARRPGDDHLPEIERLLAAPAASGAFFVLTGKATSIQRLRQTLKVLDVPATRIRTKAYWAPGKAGLD